MISRQRDKIARTETGRLTQMYDGSYQDMQQSTSEKFYQDKFGKFRESEHQKVTNTDDDYQQVENNFTPYDWVPYNPSTFPANGKPRPKSPGKKQGGDEVYECWIQGHCCDNTKGGPIKLYCTYPFDGPYKKPKSSTEVWVRKQITENSAIICAEEVTNSSPGNRCDNQFDDLWCMVHGPTQNMECSVYNLVTDVTGSAECSANSLCSQLSCTPTITSTTNQLNVGESIQLTAANKCPEKSYYFKLISGGGKVSKNGLYVAPLTNPGCAFNPTIALVCDCQTVASKTLTVTNPEETGVAYRKVVCGCMGLACAPLTYYDEWNCAGTRSASTVQCVSGWFCGCSPDNTWASTFSYNPPAMGDVRSEAMKTNGCCPSSPL